MTSKERPSRTMKSFAAPPRQKPAVAALSTVLHELARARQQASWEFVTPDGERTAIPEAVFRVLEAAASILGRGDAVTVVLLTMDLTTQQAANVLKVPRQYLVRLLDEALGRAAPRPTSD